MQRIRFVAQIALLALASIVPTAPAEASVAIGTGNASLLGGDLTDPKDIARDKPGVNYGESKSEEEMRPENVAWMSLKMSPVSPPGSPPHQTHAYQSWQGTPACKIFLNNPESAKWYMGFKDGGKGGPTKTEPYTVAVQLKDPVILTHFTMTTDKSEPVLPDRDPKSWAIQGSNTGKDDDWTDIYKCEATSRAKSPFKADVRNETTLFASFNDSSLEGRVDAESLKKLQARLKGKKLAKPDFEVPTKAYTWFRLVIYSCFNPNSTTYQDFNRPPGCALAQMELFGVPPDFKFSELKVAVEPVKNPPKPPVSDLPFIITYWCGPPKSETTLERYQEIAEAGFNVAFPALDALWSPGGKDAQEHNSKYLDLCKQVGLRALVWDGDMPRGDNWKTHSPQDIPQIEKALDDLIARYSPHPALLGYIVHDEPRNGLFPRLGLVNQYLLKKDPKHLPYINLLPTYAFTPRSDYEEHVSKYLETVKPSLVSWAHYRQMLGPAGDESTYWVNLEIMRRQCTEAGVPYNQNIVSLKHMGYRECNEVDLRWQVNTSLAFGSRGIQYFTYWYVKDLASAEAPALIGKDGKRDKKYEYVKRINQRIAKLGPTLAKLVCTGAYCNDPMPPGGVPLAEGAPLKSIEGGRVVVGCFQDAAGRRYLFPVNRTLKYIVTTKLTLDAKAESVSEISQDTGEPLEPTSLSDGMFQLRLQPAEGKLFLVNDSK